MKKTILLASLVAVASMAAGTTGTVKGFFESEGKFETNKVVSTDKKKIENKTDKSYKVGKIGVETEVKVKDTGLSFGGTFQAKDLALGNVYRPNYLNNSSVFVKYELPEIKGVNSYVKATVSPKFETVLKKDEIANKGNAELEADVSYKYNDLTFGLNTKTTLPFNNERLTSELTANPLEFSKIDYATLVSSTHKVYVKGNYAPLKDIKGEIEVNHKYKESAKDAKDAFKYLSLLADASYDVNKDLTLNGKARFKYQFNGEMNFKDQYLGDKDLIESKYGDDSYKSPAQYIHFYSLEGVYKGVKDTELSATAFVGHLHASNTVKENTKETTTKDNIAHYGIITNVKYTGVKNLTLSGKAILSGISIVKKQVVTGDATAANNKTTITKNHYGLLGFGLGAKYDYKVTDKFTVSPEFIIDSKIFVGETDAAQKNMMVGGELTLAPKVSAEYKPAESLTIKGEVSVPVNFSMIDKFKKETNEEYKNDGHKFGYKSTSIKTALNVEYKW